MEDIRKEADGTDEVLKDEEIRPEEAAEEMPEAPEEAEASEETVPEEDPETEEAEEISPEAAQDEEASEEPAESEAPEGSEEAAQEEGPAEEVPEKKGFFSRRKDKETAALKEKVAELEDRTRRQMAEFENFRKRTEKEKSQMFSMGEMNAIEKLLPVIDNFERGLASVPEDQKGDPFVDGMSKIYAQLLKQLEDMGVSPIEALGKEFDPNFHNAVMQMESDEYESGVVGQELLKGYMYHDSVLRHSMVSVVK